MDNKDTYPQPVFNETGEDLPGKQQLRVGDFSLSFEVSEEMAEALKGSNSFGCSEYRITEPVECEPQKKYSVVLATMGGFVDVTDFLTLYKLRDLQRIAESVEGEYKALINRLSAIAHILAEIRDKTCVMYDESEDIINLTAKTAMKISYSFTLISHDGNIKIRSIPQIAKGEKPKTRMAGSVAIRGPPALLRIRRLCAAVLKYTKFSIDRNWVAV